MGKRLFAVLMALVLVFGLTGQVLARSPSEVRVIIGFREGPGSSEIEEVEREAGKVKHVYGLIPAIAATVPRQAIQRLKANPKVIFVEEDGRVQAMDHDLASSWGVQRIGAGTVHTYNQAAGVRIAIIDTGINYLHPDLAPNFAGGWDFVNNDADPMDDNGHGSHVAGTAAAVLDHLGVVGVGPQSSLYGLKVLDATGSGWWSDIIAALDWSVANGMQVVNMSLGANRAPGQLRNAVRNAEAAGLVLVAAAGNNGAFVIFPAAYDPVIAVGATDSTDTAAWFSSVGEELELAAPGVAVNSTVGVAGYQAYESWSGTSMASPHVAGTAALVIASGITDANGNGRVNDEVRLRLQQTATDLGAPGWDEIYGYGLVNAAAAVPPPPAPPGAISGTVTDANTLAAIAGATVATDTGLSATTDINGVYTILSVPAGTYTVTASAAGYVSASQPVTVTSGATSTANFILTPVPPPGAIAGQVTDDATPANPIAGATVTDGTRTATTDVNGNYTIADVPAGTYTVTASAAGYVSASQVVTVTSGATATANFALAPVPSPGAIAGQVTDDATPANPIAGATVTDGTRTATTDVNGNYTIADVPAGTYTVTASAAGYVSASQVVTVTSGATATANFALAPSPLPPLSVGVTTDKNSYSIDQKVRIRVTVTDGANPVAGAAVGVQVTTASGNIYSFTGTTNDKGQVRFRYRIGAGDGTGTYTVDATASQAGYAPGQGQTTFMVTTGGGGSD